MKYLLFCFCFLLLAGCDDIYAPSPKKTPQADAQALVDSIIYVRAKNGLCYGVVTVDRLSSSLSVATNQMLVKVECSEVGL